MWRDLFDPPLTERQLEQIEERFGIIPIPKHEHNWEIRSVKTINVRAASFIYVPMEERDIVELYTIVISKCIGCGELQERKLQGSHTLKELQ